MARRIQDVRHRNLHLLHLLLTSAFIGTASVSAFFQNFVNAAKNIVPTTLSSPTIPTAEITALQTLIDDANSGRRTLDPSKEDQLKNLMMTISESRQGDQREALPGEWKLVWTTEKEVNFFKTSWPFADLSSITQQLDLYNAGTIENSINFEGGGCFAVTGTVAPVDSDDVYDRVAFTFTEAVITAWGFDIAVPPVGAGWFDTIFCNEDYRLSRDSRGDWSVFRRNP